MFDLPEASYVFDNEGWYKIKSEKGFGFAGQKIHYFFKSKKSICGRIKDAAVKLVKCDTVEYKKCSICLKQLTRYTDLNNMPCNIEE